MTRFRRGAFEFIYDKGETEIMFSDLLIPAQIDSSLLVVEGTDQEVINWIQIRLDPDELNDLISGLEKIRTQVLNQLSTNVVSNQEVLLCP